MTKGWDDKSLCLVANIALDKLIPSSFQPLTIPWPCPMILDE